MNPVSPQLIARPMTETHRGRIKEGKLNLLGFSFIALFFLFQFAKPKEDNLHPFYL